MTTDTIRLKPLQSYYFWNWILIGLSVKTPNIKKDASEITKIMSIRPGSYLGILKKNYFQDIFHHGLLHFLWFWMSAHGWVITPLNPFFLQSFQTNNRSFSCSLSLQKYIYIYFPRVFVFRGLLIYFFFCYWTCSLSKVVSEGYYRTKEKKKIHITYSHLPVGKMCVSSGQQMLFMRQLLLY